MPVAVPFRTANTQFNATQYWGAQQKYVVVRGGKGTSMLKS
jgi:hypothetical protein